MNVAVTGFLLDPSGYGEAARRTVAALEAVGVNVMPGGILQDGGKLLEPGPELKAFLQRRGTPDVNLVIAPASDWDEIRLPGRTVGYSMWETSKLHPAYEAAAKTFDRVAVPSMHNLEVYEEHGIETFVVPIPAVPEPPEAQHRLKIRDSDYVFYSILTWQERKNPFGLLVSYLTAFTGYDDVVMVIKIFGGAAEKASAERQSKAIVNALNMPNPPRIQILVAEWGAQEIWALHHRGDCFVTLSRGEAYCIPALDARSAGNAVIATDYGGHMDFLTDNNGMTGKGVYPVDFRLTPVVAEYPYFNGAQQWADPDLVHASNCMHTAVRDGRWDSKLIRETVAGLTPEAVGRLWLEVLRA